MVVAACSGKASTDRPPVAHAKPALPAKRTEGAGVTVTGNVLETTTRTPAAGIEVVFANATREETTRTGPDGKYKLALPAGSYRVFVRDDEVMSVGMSDRVRLQTLPGALAAGHLDERLAPEIAIDRDADDVDLPVVRTGVVTGVVARVDNTPISGAVVSAHGNNLPRPVLGTDVAVTRADGSFELRLPDGEYVLAISHPAFADIVNVGRIETVKGGNHHVSLTMMKGCIISGHVVDAAGKPVAIEGALERKVGATDLDFQPNGRIDSDGTFRWTTTDESEVVLRAWPWHQPPSPPRRFTCKDGAVFDTTFALPAREPDLSGLLFDRDGGAVPFTHLDVQPLDPGGVAQQERTDENGHWAVFALPPGRYSITAQGRGGAVSMPVTSPGKDVILKLSGAGRIEGTTPQLARGSFELSFGACLDGNTVQLPHDRRIVVVDAGQFVVDNVPACDLQFDAIWHGETISTRTVVPAGGAARVQLDLGTPRDKTVIGVVRDREGRGVGKVHVTATYKKSSATAITDERGKFAIDTVAGATISVEVGTSRGEALVGLANVPRERVDIVLIGDGLH